MKIVFCVHPILTTWSLAEKCFGKQYARVNIVILLVLTLPLSMIQKRNVIQITTFLILFFFSLNCRTMRHPLDWNFMHQFCFYFICILICILTYLLIIILSLLCIIVGIIAHNCWLRPVYWLVDHVNFSINNTSCDPNTAHTYIFILHYSIT